MDFKNWMLLLLIVGLAGLYLYSVYNNSSQQEEVAREVTPTPTPEVDSNSEEIPEDWQEYSGESIVFYHPSEWEPEARDPFGGTVIEDINLNIPETEESDIFYSATPYDSVRPDNISEENEREIKDRMWIEWVRESEEQVNYDLFTKEEIADAAGSFGVHVTLSEEDEELKNQLITLIENLEFIEEDSVNSSDSTSSAN